MECENKTIRELCPHGQTSFMHEISEYLDSSVLHHTIDLSHLKSWDIFASSAGM
jgi:hypothetical protein